MPFYDFDCPACGAFTAMRPMAQSAEACGCPDCGVSSPRALSAPAILRGHSGRSLRAEASAEPASSGAAAHPAGCGCCARRSPALDSLAAAGGRVFTAHGPVRNEGF